MSGRKGWGRGKEGKGGGRKEQKEGEGEGRRGREEGKGGRGEEGERGEEEGGGGEGGRKVSKDSAAQKSNYLIVSTALFITSTFCFS